MFMIIGYFWPNMLNGEKNTSDTYFQCITIFFVENNFCEAIFAGWMSRQEVQLYIRVFL